MRRLLRWTFNTLAAASLLLCLATAGLWVRSYWVYDECYAIDNSDGYAFAIWSQRGQLACSYDWHEGRPMSLSKFQFDQLPEGSRELASGFRFSRERYSETGYIAITWGARDWALVAAFALLPSVIALRQIRAVRRRRHRSRLGLCPACGYDLRPTPGRCPECGRADDKVRT